MLAYLSESFHIRLKKRNFALLLLLSAGGITGHADGPLVL